MCSCRFPQLHIIGFQSGGSASSAADRSNLIQLIMKENITFPILLSNKNFSEVRFSFFLVLNIIFYVCVYYFVSVVGVLF